ncbi:MAG: hypothetical protein IPJ78_06775 [Gemmatimonadetes bacterium]|nr:hypothetical protein [Gemmatimonadota bacterium]
MIHAPVPPEDWAAEGARAAPALAEVAAALVIGSDPQVAALVARAMAGAQPRDRRVAIGDLVGDLRALVPPTDLVIRIADAEPPPAPEDGPRPGLLQCFRDGLSVTSIARPLTEDGRIFVLPAGGALAQDRLLMESPRWPRLISGFREVDALLLLVADARTPGLESLMSAVDGVVAVDLPPVQLRRWPLLATVDRPEPELLPVAPIPDRAPRPSSAGRRGRLAAVLGLATVAGIAGWAFATGRFDAMRRSGAPAAITDTAAVASAIAAPPESLGVAGTPDTITLGSIVNPDDSATATAYSVELVAANTLAGANSGLAMRGATLPAPTLAPVLLGADGRPWYRALTGAWHARAEAEAFLTTLRDRGLVRDDVGRVLRAPYALLLAEGVPPDQADAARAQWESRGIPAYALLQADGRARLFAGAFETPGQSVLVALSLRDIGVEPVLAFRTGRMF